MLCNGSSVSCGPSEAASSHWKEATPQDKPPSAAAPAHRKLKIRAGTGRLRVVDLPPSVPAVRDKEPPPPTLVGLPMGVSPLPVQDPPRARRTVKTQPPTPAWLPIPLEPSSSMPYDHHDPRTFFVGAPSSYLQGVPAAFLKKQRQEARGTGQWECRFQDPLSPPEGVAAIVKKERATLPDGTVYELEATWVRDPTFCMKSSKGTQFPEL